MSPRSLKDGAATRSSSSQLKRVFEALPSPGGKGMRPARRTDSLRDPMGRTGEAGPDGLQAGKLLGRRHFPLVLGLLLVLGLCAACSYSFKGSLPPHLRTVAIPPIVNETAEFGVAEDLGELVLARFLRDGLLRVTDEERADSRLVLSFKQISEAPFAYSQDEVTSQVRLTIRLHGEFMDRVEDRELWQKDFSEWGTYDPNGTPTRADAIAEAARKLVEAINQQLVADW